MKFLFMESSRVGLKRLPGKTAIVHSLEIRSRWRGRGRENPTAAVLQKASTIAQNLDFLTTSTT